MNVKHIGVLAVLLASLMWAIEPVFAKLAYQQNPDFVQISAIRAIFVTLTALIYIGLTRNAKLRIDKQQFSILAYIAIAGTLFADLLYFFALTQIPVINAVLIGHMQPIFIIMIGFLILKSDKLTKFDFAGISIMMLSGLLVSTKTIENFAMFKFGTFGDLLVLMATIAWATTAIAVRKHLKNLNAGVITFYRFLFASIFLVIYLGLTSTINITNIYQILVGVVVGIGTILYYEGLKRIKAAQVSGLELSAPFFAAILGFLILGEPLTLIQIMGISLLFVGIYYLSKKEDIG
ncbi:MAG: DMT family transporter [Candidatus Thermoplasmatota archaeon]|nr:DMT family transporter [Candidatus Thermoplasmatota archaeon]